ncbi:hypothetical protein [Snodgrassella alvi]|uniref:hypothetical protein n=1 Tax=Snodgrassella alvi TaxID=1196083 RepID=UPI00117BD95C|nr:hypothetical protein [Snodgrassella alvi]
MRGGVLEPYGLFLLNPLDCLLILPVIASPQVVGTNPFLGSENLFTSAGESLSSKFLTLAL